MGLMPDDVHHCAFSAPAVGQRGYRRDEVDALLERVEQAITAHLAGREPSLKGRDLPEFPLRRAGFFARGYNPDEVAAFLDLCEAELKRLEGSDEPLRGRDLPSD